MVDDAISNYKRNIMIQIIVLLNLFIEPLLRWVRKVDYSSKCHKIFFKTAKIGGTPPAYTN